MPVTDKDFDTLVQVVKHLHETVTLLNDKCNSLIKINENLTTIVSCLQEQVYTLPAKEDVRTCIQCMDTPVIANSLYCDDCSPFKSSVQ